MGGCDYSGSPESVEGHISAMRDEAHQGETGSQYRHLLEPAGEAEEDATGSATEAEGSEGVAGSSPGATVDAESDRDAAIAAGATAGAAAFPLALEELEVSHLVVLAAVVVVVYLLLVRGGSSSASDQEQREQVGEEAGGFGGVV